ncbi:protein of unknown function [Paraburkholderia kururiensis]
MFGSPLMYSRPASRRPYSVTLLCACATTPADIRAAASKAFFIFSSIPCQEVNPVLRMVFARITRRTGTGIGRRCTEDRCGMTRPDNWLLSRHADPALTGVSSVFEVKLLLINFVLLLWLLI